MPKKPENFALEIQAEMHNESRKVITKLWPEFYTETDIKRFGGPYSESIRNACSALGIVVGYGQNVVTFCQDTKFSG